MKPLALCIFVLFSFTAFADRQTGFLLPTKDVPPLDLKKFKTEECQFDVKCYPVFSVTEKKGTKIYEIKGVNDKPYLVREGELNLKFLEMDDYLNTAMLDFLGTEEDLRADYKTEGKPTWLNYKNIPAPQGLATLQETKKALAVFPSPKGKEFENVTLIFDTLSRSIYAKCDGKECKIPYFGEEEGYIKVLVLSDSFKALVTGDEPKFLWLKKSKLDGTDKLAEDAAKAMAAEMSKVLELPLTWVDVVSVKSVENQIWLQVDFLKSGRCDNQEKKLLGRAWIPVYKSDDSFNIKWYGAGCEK